MLRTSCLTVLAGVLLTTSAFAQDEVILRLLPYHTDAMVENFNPNNPTGPQQRTRDFTYEPMWIDNLWHPGENEAALAVSFEIPEDLKSITYKLREGVKWSDGEDFDADDVVFSFEYAKAHPDFPMGIDVYNAEAGTGNVVSAEKIDDHTVKFNLNKPDALARYGLAGLYPLPEHIWKSVDDPKNFANLNPVATGPWTKVRNFSRNGYEICRNELSRFNAENAIDCLKFPQMNGNEQTVAALSAGELDWLGDGLTDPDVTFLPQSEFNNYWLPAGSDVNLQLNTTKAPFNNLEFRKAMSVAIDRDTLVEISTFGLTTHTKFPIGTGEMFNTWYNEAALEPYTWLMKYDAEKAKELLDTAGFVDKDGDGWRDNPDGTPIAFGISMPSGWTDWVNTGQTVAENLQDVGINASLKTMDQGAWFDGVPQGNFDVYVMWTNGGPTPHSQYHPMFNPRQMVPGQIDFQAMHQMPLPAAEEALVRFQSTSDRDAQLAALLEVHKAVAENVPVVSLFANPTWFEYSTRRFTGWVTKENPFVRPQVHDGTRERVLHALALKPIAQH
ncbi:ABC transporter substrate-binding protein [Devosia sp. ZB163]|uniref:ABC transporter substrate-binding protein n=1 Tax=Devosia sp. ZB163 TaxID=3025938 RepID=UPI00235EA393|nr:ABC transporter substrate-binding protein [Devosia sp. ZB163]MDC9825134.1 ABC transporter substrate-binding protein [Devosia sp. ZB163]